MGHGFTAQLVALAAGVLLATCVLLVWRRELRPAVALIGVQGLALAALVAGIALVEGSPELGVVAVLVGALKGGIVPWVLERGVRRGGSARDLGGLNPTTALLGVALLTTLAYLVSRPVVAALGSAPVAGPATTAVPVGLAMVLIGFLLLATRHRALSHLVGFLVLDNGIATVAFVTAAGVPLLVELGTTVELLLVVLILVVLTGQIRQLAGPRGLDAMRELSD